MSKIKSGEIEYPLRLQKFSISNFKALDSLQLTFQPPLMTNDPDIYVIGSQNGIGKTSIFEASSLLYTACLVGEEFVGRFRRGRNFVDLTDNWVRAGTNESQIHAEFSHRDQVINVNLNLTKKGTAKISGDLDYFKELRNRMDADREELLDRTLSVLSGLESDPLILPGFMYFHSYRRVQDGNPELGMLVRPVRSLARHRMEMRYERHETPISSFKLEALRLMMSQGGLFENVIDNESEVALETLNKFVKKFAKGQIEKLRSSSDNTLEFRVTPANGPSFSFDGLSSGQKEIISTLFLIWRHRASGNIVLLDEPELHLNAEWHKQLVLSLNEFAHVNQYLVATHSEDVFASVDSERRIILSPDGVHK